MLYALRRIVASEQLAAVSDIAAVSANLGHANPQITLKAYAHPLPGAQRSATVSIGAIWRKKLNDFSVLTNFYFLRSRT